MLNVFIKDLGPFVWVWTSADAFACEEEWLDSVSEPNMIKCLWT